MVKYFIEDTCSLETDIKEVSYSECKESIIYNNRIAKEYGDRGLKRAEINDFMDSKFDDCAEVNGFRYWKEIK